MAASAITRAGSRGSEVRATGLHVVLGGRPILCDISLTFRPGRVYGIVGPNGCGKTTLIRALSGALKPASGRVLLDGRPIQAMRTSAIARKMAVVWQGGPVPADLTVRRLIAYGRYAHLSWWQLSSSSGDDAVDRAMHSTGVYEMANRRVDTLSGGERQRVWLAAALAQQPTVLLLDEPTTYLDIAHQIDILDLVSSLNRDWNLTVIAVLHDLTQTARLCDECLVLCDGRIVSAGPPDQALSVTGIAEHFEVEAWVTVDPVTQAPVIQPRRRIGSQAGKL